MGTPLKRRKKLWGKSPSKKKSPEFDLEEVNTNSKNGGGAPHLR